MIKEKEIDWCGKAIVGLFSLILWYKEIIMVYYPISNAFFILGIILSALVIYDSMTTYKKVLYKLPKECYYIFYYIIGVYLMGFLVSPNVSSHMRNGFTIIQFAILFLFFCYYLKTRKSGDFIVWNYLWINIVLGIIAIRNPSTYQDEEQLRFSISESLNPNSLSITFSLGIWSALYLLSKKKLNIIFCLAVIPLFLYINILTASKKGFINIAICLVVFFIYIFARAIKNNKVLPVFMLALGLIALSYLVYIYFYESFLETELMNRFSNYSEDQSTLSREAMYSDGLKYFLSSPIFGYGFFGFQELFGLYSHSTLVEVFVSGGLFLGILYFSAYFIILKKFRIVYKNTKAITNQIDILSTMMFFILFLIILFDCSCMIHIYNLKSFYNFGLIILFLTNLLDKYNIESEMKGKIS